MCWYIVYLRYWLTECLLMRRSCCRSSNALGLQKPILKSGQVTFQTAVVKVLAKARACSEQPQQPSSWHNVQGSCFCLLSKHAQRPTRSLGSAQVAKYIVHGESVHGSCIRLQGIEKLNTSYRFKLKWTGFIMNTVSSANEIKQENVVETVIMQLQLQGFPG